MTKYEIMQEIDRIAQEMQQAILECDYEEVLICEEAIAQLEAEL